MVPRYVTVHSYSKNKRKADIRNRRPLFRLWSIPRETVSTLFYGFERAVHFLTGGRFLPPNAIRKKAKRRGRLGRGCCEQNYEHGMILALRPSTLQLVLDVNNNAIAGPHLETNMEDSHQDGRPIPFWFIRCLVPKVSGDPKHMDDPDCFTLELRHSWQGLPKFLHVVAEKARQNIGDWLTHDPSLMISIPMIPKFIPGDRLGFIFQYGRPIQLASSDTRDTFLGYLCPSATSYQHMQPVAINFFKAGRGCRDVDILREAGIMQHLDHRRVMPKFHGLAVVNTSEQYCQWVTVSEYVNTDTSVPTDLSTFIQSEIIRRKIFLISCLRWYDWINLVRKLLQNLHLIHEDRVVVGDLNMESILVQKHGNRYVPSVVGFAHACYGDYAASHVLKGMTREPLPACAHGYDDTPLPCHMDPALAYDALACPPHDIYSYGHIIKNIGVSMFIPELEKLGLGIMQSRPQDRRDGGSHCASHMVHELRTLTFRHSGHSSCCAPLDCYELSRHLLQRAPLTGSLAAF